MWQPEVKIAKIEDLKDVLDLQYRSFKTEADRYGAENIPAMQQTIADLYDDYMNGIILLIRNEAGAAVGSVRAHIHYGTVYVGKLFVHPRYRREGLATMLLGAIEKEMPGTRYELFTGSQSVGTIRLYERAGYRQFKRLRVNEEFSLIYMEKRVRKQYW